MKVATARNVIIAVGLAPWIGFLLEYVLMPGFVVPALNHPFIRLLILALIVFQVVGLAICYRLLCVGDKTDLPPSSMRTRQQMQTRAIVLLVALGIFQLCAAASIGIAGPVVVSVVDQSLPPILRSGSGK
ncbi:MAG: hypothetical protein U0105_02065 [Candidatus Obscuribacterales bacterium]